MARGHRDLLQLAKRFYTDEEQAQRAFAREHAREYRAAVQRGERFSMDDITARVVEKRAAQVTRAASKAAAAEAKRVKTAAIIAAQEARDRARAEKHAAREAENLRRAAANDARYTPAALAARAKRARDKKKAYWTRMRVERPEKYRALRSAARKRYRQRYPERCRARERIREARRDDRTATATPPWLEVKTLLPILADCIERNRAQPGSHHVDHIAPLKGKTCSGLHVPWNLRVIESVENQAKGNKLNHDLLITLEERQQVVYTY